MTIPGTTLFAMLAELITLKTAPLAAAPVRCRKQPVATRHARQDAEYTAALNRQRTRHYMPYR
jgi:hypothetical protein